jgi:hypothetical protein
MEPPLSGSTMDVLDALNLPEIYPPPNGAHKDCLICEGHFPSVKVQQQMPQQLNGLPRKAKVGDETAQELLSLYMSDNLKNLQHVRNMLHSHGDLILRRWKKYSPERRTELLTKASPFVFQKIRSLEFLDGPGSLGDSAHRYISWLDVVDFSKDRMRLMSLLHVRSEHGPEQWAAFDTRSAWLACRQTTWPLYVHNANAVVMHGERYGELVPFAVNSAHSWKEVGFPRAQLTFFVQERISAALSAVVDLIIDGEKPLGSAKWTAFLSKGLRSAYEDALWGSYYHQEFTPPSHFDPEVISEKASNHLNMLVDEMELAQTDPKHMYRYALELKKDTFVSEDGEKSRRCVDQGDSSYRFQEDE